MFSSSWVPPFPTALIYSFGEVCPRQRRRLISCVSLRAYKGSLVSCNAGLKRGPLLVAASTSSVQPLRAFATKGRSTSRERRYYREPLRRPRHGISTLVSRRRSDADLIARYGTKVVEVVGWTSPMEQEEVIAGGLGHRLGLTHSSAAPRSLSVFRTLQARLMRFIYAHCCHIQYNKAGVPVSGSVLLLPWREQLRLLGALIGAFFITKLFYRAARFELLYYGLWKLEYRNDETFARRLLYYGTTAMLAAGLYVSSLANFFLTACLLGRREMAGYVVFHALACIIPRRRLLTFWLYVRSFAA